ncbi:MAG: hypothetical protein GTN74_01005 [Proteobacteria bacterium]|nr:hypothetical protein [Pseudomonadota bacterium]NIS67617.1 hypothetical protein [Pseudomonadota bacterium]
MTKKKAKKKKTPEALSPKIASAVQTIVQEIKDGETKGEPLKISLQKIESEIGPSAEKGMAVVTALGSIPTERTARLLQGLSRSVSEKSVLKAIKRSLYRIEQRGIPVEASEKETLEPSILRPAVEEQSRGFISAVDSEGSQIVFLTVSRRPKGLYLLQGIVSDTKGLIEFNRVETTKRGFKDFYQSIKTPEQLPIVEVDVGYCRFRLEEAAELTGQRGGSPPSAYLSSKRDIEKIERVETPPVFLLLDEKEVQRDTSLLGGTADLFQNEPFSSWFLPAEEVQTYAKLIQEAEESRLVLNPAQKEQRLQETYRKALIELFTEEKRLLYRRRLEEMAYVLLKEGYKDRAKAALAASIDLRSAPKALDLQPNPFLLNLVIRSIYALVARDMEKKKADPSLVVKP